MPGNDAHLGLLGTLVPYATFFHCRPDLRDIAASCWMTGLRSIRRASEAAHIASRFREYRRVMAHWSEVLPVTVHHVDDKETAVDPKGVARRLLSACGLERILWFGSSGSRVGSPRGKSSSGTPGRVGVEEETVRTRGADSEGT